MDPSVAEEPASSSLAAQSQQQSQFTPLDSSVIPMANKLQNTLAQPGSRSMIELPQMTVVGSQSGGKSKSLNLQKNQSASRPRKFSNACKIWSGLLSSSSGPSSEAGDYELVEEREEEDSGES